MLTFLLQSYVNPILGVSFETSSDSLIDQIPSALGVFAEAVEGFIRVPSNQVKIKSPDSSEFSLIMLSCLSRFVCKLIYFRSCCCLPDYPVWMGPAPPSRLAGHWGINFTSIKSNGKEVCFIVTICRSDTSPAPLPGRRVSRIFGSPSPGL